MSENYDRDMEAAGQRFAQEMMKRYSQAECEVMGYIMPNLLNGCSWAFLSDEEAKNSYSLIKQDSNAELYKVSNGGILLGNFEKLVTMLTSVAGYIYTQEDLDRAVMYRNKAVADLQKYLQKKGPGVIGIYNLNDTPNITVKGTTYKAFNVDLETLLSACNMLGMQNFVQSIVSQNKAQVFANLQIAPSGNAMLIDVR